MKKIFLLILLVFLPTSALADDATTTPATSTPPAPASVTITIRDGDITAFTGVVELAASTTANVAIAPSNSSTTVAVPANSLLATLVALDATTTDFDITDLAYFSSFNSFIINCIAVPAVPTTPHCFNWTYAVNGSFPQVGIDDTLLHDGDIIHLFFGPSRQTVLSTTTAKMGESFTATAEHYDLASGTYLPSPSLVLGVGTPNADFSFTELATSTSDANGQVIFSLNATGTYAVGIQEDFYFPSASITITEVATTTDPSTDSGQATTTPPAQPSSGGGGGGGIVHIQLNVPSAISYLVSKQKSDGSFDNSVLTDWAALAFATSDPGVAKTNLRTYLLTAAPSLSSATDYERHAMALMALGIDPYSGTPRDYIAPIVSAFDGTQIGSLDFENDDIFALFPLLHAGYGESDDIIKKTVAFIISRQAANGSWTGGVDMTAAAVQALVPLSSLPSVSVALTKAEAYLHAQQRSNGGFGENGQSNSFATSWTLQAIAALGQSPLNWTSGGLNPNDYLSSLQQPDGGVESASSDANMRVWATEYAIPASLGKTWNSLLQSFSKPATSNSGGTVLGASTSTLATTTLAMSATTTPSVATSTPPTLPSTLDIIGTTTVQTAQTPPPPIPKIKGLTPKIKKAVAEPKPAATSSATATDQTAAAASVPTTSPGQESFFGTLWRGITSFFSWLF